MTGSQETSSGGISLTTRSQHFLKQIMMRSCKMNLDENDDPEINIIKDSMNDDDENYVDLDENGE